MNKREREYVFIEQPLKHRRKQPPHYRDIQVPFPPDVDPASLVRWNDDGTLKARSTNAFFIYRNQYARALEVKGYKLCMREVSRLAAQSWQEQPMNVTIRYEQITRSVNALREKILAELEQKAMVAASQGATEARCSSVNAGPTFSIPTPGPSSTLSSPTSLSMGRPSSVPLTPDMHSKPASSTELPNFALPFTTTGTGTSSFAVNRPAPPPMSPLTQSTVDLPLSYSEEDATRKATFMLRDFVESLGSLPSTPTMSKRSIITSKAAAMLRDFGPNLVRSIIGPHTEFDFSADVSRQLVYLCEILQIDINMLLSEMELAKEVGWHDVSQL